MVKDALFGAPLRGEGVLDQPPGAGKLAAMDLRGSGAAADVSYGRKADVLSPRQNERMKASIDKGVGLALWGLLLAGGCWAVYSSYWFLWLARSFPSPGPSRAGWALADMQGYAVVFGPVAIVAVLFAVRTIGRRRKGGR